MSRYQKGKTNLDFTEARDTEGQWHQLGHMLQTDNHASTPPLSFSQAGCPSCRPANSVKALKALSYQQSVKGAITVTNVFTYKMAAKINWHRYGTKSRHCHPMYRHAGCLQRSHVRTADPFADGRRSAASRTAIGRGGYRLAAPGVISC